MILTNLIAKAQSYKDHKGNKSSFQDNAMSKTESQRPGQIFRSKTLIRMRCFSLFSVTPLFLSVSVVGFQACRHCV